MTTLTERCINPEISYIMDGDKHVGSVMKAGKEWMWTFIPTQSFGFVADVGMAATRIRNLHRAFARKA